MKIFRIKNLIPAPKDAEQLLLTVSPSSLSLDKDGEWKNDRDTFTVEVWKQKGNEEPTQTGMGDYAVYVYKNGSSTVSVLKKNTPSFQVQASKTDTSLDVRLKVGDAFTQTVTVAVTVDGASGKGISSVVEYYLATSLASGVTKDTDGWTTDSSSSDATINAVNKYLWNYEMIIYTDGSRKSTEPAIIGRYGDKGVGISKITEYYLASSLSSGVTASTSGWTTDPTAKAAKMTATKKYLWNYEAIEYTDGSTDKTAPVIIGVYGDKGDTGEKGVSVISTKYYYLATTMDSGVTRSTLGWTADYQQGTQDLPYVWRYGDTSLSDGSHQYTECEMVYSFSTGANPNLLENTNFSSLMGMEKWTRRNLLITRTGEAVTGSYASVGTGLQAHNAYYDRTSHTTAQIQYMEVLEQCLYNTTGTIRKLEAGAWYTFSFWAKGVGVHTYIYPSAFDNSSVCYIDGVAKAVGTLGSDAHIEWTLTDEWVRHTFTFKTGADISGNDQKLLFRLYPKSAANILNCVYLCMPKLEVGMQATNYMSCDNSLHTGQPRNRRWTSNTQYLCGAPDEKYDDTVLVGTAGFYHCIRSHVSSESNKPGSGESWENYWEAGSKIENLATDLVLAQKAIIQNLISSMVQTEYEGNARVEMYGSVFRIFGRGKTFPSIELAEQEGVQVLRFYDQTKDDGSVLYDLGPSGISSTPSQNELITSINDYQVVGLTDNSDVELTDAWSYESTIFSKSKQSMVTMLYKYQGKMVAGVWNAGKYCDTAEHAQEATGRIFLTQASSSSTGQKFIRDIKPFTGLVCRLSSINEYTDPSYLTGKEGWNEGDVAVPDDNEMWSECDFTVGEDGKYAKTVYARRVLHFTEGIRDGSFNYYTNNIY